jgi:PHD/YefM family antitoxin component YafN of YafNO toxin-antitoxin module
MRIKQKSCVKTPIVSLINSQTDVLITNRVHSEYLCISVKDKSVLLDKSQAERLLMELSDIVNQIKTTSHGKTESTD